MKKSKMPIIKLYAYRDTEDPKRILALLDARKFTVGTVIPGFDGNYYYELVVCGRKKGQEFTLGAEGFLNFLNKMIDKGNLKIDKEFAFDPEKLEIIELSSK